MLTLSLHQRREIRDKNLINIKDTVSKFVPKDTIKELARIVNTPEAWAINKAGLYPSIGSHSKTSHVDTTI